MGMSLSLGLQLGNQQSSGGPAAPVLTIPSTAPVSAIYDVGYDDTRQITNGTPYAATTGRAPYTVAVTTGALPTGLSASVDMDGKLRINGVPSGAAGTANFTLTVTDSLGVTAALPTSITVPVVPTGLVATFGVKTRAGHGGHACGYRGGGTVTIQSQTTANRWAINDENKLVANGTYNNAPTVALSAGSDTVVLTDGTNTWSVTATMVASAAHIAPRPVAVLSGGVNGAADGTGSTGTWQFRTIFTGANIALGDTIYLRNGYHNPAGNDARMRPLTNFSGTGRITIRSEWADASLDAYGNPNRKHGGMVGTLTHDSASIGDVEVFADIVDLYCYTNVTAGKAGFRYVSLGFGYGASNCRFENGPLVTTKANGFTLIGSASNANANVRSCTFQNVANGVAVNKSAAAGVTTGSTIELCDFFAINADSINVGDGNMSGGFVQDNFALNYNDTGVHNDILQLSDNTTGSAITPPTMRRNIVLHRTTGGVQGMFSGGTAVTTMWTGMVVQNNILVITDANGVYTRRHDSLDIRYNTVIQSRLSATNTNTPSIVQPLGQVGSGMTLTHNVANGYDTNQGGSVTNTNNKTLTKSQAAYDAAFASYVEATPGNRKQVIALVTPALNGTLKNGDSTYAGAVLPDGNWNTGAVYP